MNLIRLTKVSFLKYNPGCIVYSEGDRAIAFLPFREYRRIPIKWDKDGKPTKHLSLLHSFLIRLAIKSLCRLLP